MHCKTLYHKSYNYISQKLLTLAFQHTKHLNSFRSQKETPHGSIKLCTNTAMVESACPKTTLLTPHLQNIQLYSHSGVDDLSWLKPEHDIVAQICKGCRQIYHCPCPFNKSLIIAVCSSFISHMAFCKKEQNRQHQIYRTFDYKVTVVLELSCLSGFTKVYYSNDLLLLRTCCCHISCFALLACMTLSR